LSTSCHNCSKHPDCLYNTTARGLKTRERGQRRDHAMITASENRLWPTG